MGLLYEVLKLSPWHIQSGGAKRNASLFTGLFSYTSPQAQVRAYNLKELWLHVCKCVVWWVDNYAD